MAKKILIPVDFSEHSYKAITYACELNKLVYHDFDLVHIFTGHKDTTVELNFLDPQVGDAKRDMQNIVSKLVEMDSELNVNVLFKEGNLYTEIKKLSASHEYNAIVMGTKGAAGLDAVLVGSNMYDVFEN